MKKLVMMMFVSIVAIGNINAQEAVKEKKTPEQRAENAAKKMAKELTLSADQEAKVKALILKKHQAMEAERKRKPEGMQKMDSEMKAILNVDQLAKYEQMKKEKMEKQKEKHHQKEKPHPVDSK